MKILFRTVKESEFLRELQDVFEYSVVEKFGEVGKEHIPPDADVQQSLYAPNAAIYHIICDGEKVGGVVLQINEVTQHNSVDLFCRWNNNEIWIRSRSGIDACIMIRGIDGSLRGIHFKHHRPQLVLLDDLLKDDTAKSEAKREHTFTDVVIPIGTRDTNILVVGTILNEEDLMADLLKGKIPGVRSIKKAVYGKIKVQQMAR